MVSVILKTRNNASRLAITLGTIAQLHPPDGGWELIVVDNGSTDATRQVLAATGGALPLRVVYEPVPGASRACNAGLAAATGRLLVFTDDDVAVPGDWLLSYAAAHRSHGGRHYYGGPLESDYESPLSPELLAYAPASVKGLDWGQEEHVLRRNEWLVGANWACDAGRLREVGGFNLQMGLGQVAGPGVGEESEMMYRLDSAGLSGLYLPQARIRHWVPTRKTTAEHIMHRWEEGIAAQAVRNPSPAGTATFFGVPRWLVREVPAAMAAYALKAVLGRRSVEAEARLRKARGSLRGALMRRRLGRTRQPLAPDKP